VSLRVGTSGYSYPWNKGKPTSFAWYLAQGFSTVEINASYYRFPMRNWLKAWEIAPEGFEFAIKVNRSITHFAPLGANSLDLWERFRSTLAALEERKQLSEYLFQMPPDYDASEENIRTLSDFFQSIDLGNKAVVEFREKSWWDHMKEIESLGIVFCSIDTPKLPRDIVAMNGVVYLRLHGRKSWYSSVYSESELDEIRQKLDSLQTDRKYVFLNNDHGMLPNGKYLMKENGNSGLTEKDQAVLIP
jgi:uncharacterized protein YecE (DUF72 family)